MIDTQACISRHPHPNLDLKKWQTTVNLMAELFDTRAGLIVQFRQGEFNTVAASENPDNFLERDNSWPWEMKSFCRRIMETGKGLYVPDADQQDDWKDAPPVCDGPVRSYYGLPLLWPDKSLFGTICCIDTRHTGYNETQLQLLENFRELINADLHMLFDYEKIKSLAITDDLTGVHNRRGLNLLGEQRLKDARRFRQSVGMVYIDIDNMKQLNDSHGHPAGDECITTMADILSESCRESDIIARVGGDEFVVMLLADDEQHLQQYCRRVEQLFGEKLASDSRFRANSLSYGYCFEQDADKVCMDTMIELADQQMYLNKRANKLNRSA